MQQPPRPGQAPSPEQIAAMQQQIAAEAQKAGLTVPQYLQRLQQAHQQRLQAMQQQQQQQPGAAGGPQQAQPLPPPGAAAGGPPPQAQPIQPGPPTPLALAMAKFLRSQDLKLRTVILNGERKDMFRVKRALRALQSPAYAAARKKTPALPEITDRASLENAFKLLPMSMLALRVVQDEAAGGDPHAGHDHGPAGDNSAGSAGGKKKGSKKTNAAGGKRVKGLWTVRIERQQDAADDMYYVWFYEGSQTMRKLYAGLALLAIFAVVLYPLWPATMRQGVYYLSWATIGLLGLFFAMAIFRVILFCITYFVVPPGLWLYPNLWEDVSFMDSFRPVWAWHDPNPKKKKKSKAASAAASPAAQAQFAGATGQPLPATATTTAATTQAHAVPTKRPAGSKVAQVEEVEDDE